MSTSFVNFCYVVTLMSPFKTLKVLAVALESMDYCCFRKHGLLEEIFSCDNVLHGDSNKERTNEIESKRQVVMFKMVVDFLGKVNG